MDRIIIKIILMTRQRAKCDLEKRDARTHGQTDLFDLQKCIHKCVRLIARNAFINAFVKASLMHSLNNSF